MSSSDFHRGRREGMQLGFGDGFFVGFCCATLLLVFLAVFAH